ncbi:MAG: hypothetical protein IJW45_01965 [Oscillospiraceae bacterium]|nr:hypothetical protein [Oscillospiraceae bacterium]
MKKLISLLVIMCMLAALAACGEKPQPTTQPTEGKAPSTSEAPQDPTDETTAPSQPDPTETTGAPEPVTETLEAQLWTLEYDPAVWTIDEDYFNDMEGWSQVFMIIPDGDDGYLVNVEIDVSIEGPASFRSRLESLGFDAYRYAVEQSYELTPVGGVDCLVHEGEYWGEACVRYFERVEEASATVYIEICGDVEDPQVARLLEGLTFRLEDIGNQDAPWPWEGVPFMSEDRSFTMGGITVDSWWAPFDEPITTFETFDHSVTMAGDRVYVLTDGELREYRFQGDALIWQDTVMEDAWIDALQSTADGRMWSSGFGEDLDVWQDGQVIASYQGCDNVSMHPSGDWGISWFSGPDVQKVVFSDGSANFISMCFPQVSVISHLIVDEDYIYVCGYAADDSGHKVFLYDEDGFLLDVLGDENGESLGSITFMGQIPGGFMGIDSNLQELVFWAEDGTHLGTIDHDQLFETDYPWICDATWMDDGRILLIMTDERPDQSATELVAFMLSVSK